MEINYLHPGEYLRQVRESLALSRDEIGARLNLDVRVIQYIEEGQFDRLPGKIFVTGYMRSYAKLLDVSIEDLIAQMGQDEKQSDLLPANVNYGSRTVVKTSRRLNLLWPVVAALLILVVIAGIIWMDVPQEVTRTSSETADTQQSETSTAMSQEQAEFVPGQEQAHAESESSPLQSNALENSGSTEATTAAAPQQLQQDSKAAIEAPSSGVALASIQFKYNDDSWTEVTDADGKQLIYQLVAAGETVKLSGAPPFRVFLGYATGVQVSYQGKQFDHSRFIRGDLAQFVVGNR